jgi:hypothetical protein
MLAEFVADPESLYGILNLDADFAPSAGGQLGDCAGIHFHRAPSDSAVPV